MPYAFLLPKAQGLCKRGNRKILELTEAMTHAHDLHKTKWNKIPARNKGSRLRSSNHSKESDCYLQQVKKENQLFFNLVPLGITTKYQSKPQVQEQLTKIN